MFKWVCWSDQLDRPAGQTSWTDQLDYQLDGPAKQTSFRVRDLPKILISTIISLYRYNHSHGYHNVCPTIAGSQPSPPMCPYSHTLASIQTGGPAVVPTVAAGSQSLVCNVCIQLLKKLTKKGEDWK